MGYQGPYLFLCRLPGHCFPFTSSWQAEVERGKAWPMSITLDETPTERTVEALRCPYCLDWHSAGSDGPYPVEFCALDA